MVLSGYDFVVQASSCYAVLGVSPQASKNEVYTAFVARIMQAHHDPRGMTIAHDELTTAYRQACTNIAIAQDNAVNIIGMAMRKELQQEQAQQANSQEDENPMIAFAIAIQRIVQEWRAQEEQQVNPQEALAQECMDEQDQEKRFNREIEALAQQLMDELDR